MKTSVFIATSGRPKMFKSMLESLYRTTQGLDVEVVAVIDADYEAWDIARDLGCGVWFSQKRRGALTAWNDALTMTTGTLLTPAGDDQLFHPDWLKYALESHQERLGGYGVVGMNDLAYDGNTQVSTMFLFDRRYCQEVMGGIFAPPCYEYLCVDLEWNDKAKALGRFWWDERSKVEHLHSAHGKRLVDELDLAKDEGMVKRDTATFEKRKAEGFPVEWNAII